MKHRSLDARFIASICRSSRWMSLLLACLCLTNNHVLGYLPSRSRQHPIQQSASLLFAKIKKLQDAFDLSVIEAFELELEQQDTMEDDHDDDDDDEQIIAMQFNDDSSPSMLTWQVPPEYHNTRIDAALAACLVNESRSACGSLVTEGCVQDGVTHEVLNKKSYKVQEGQTLRINLSQRDAKVPTDILVPENIPLDILYEDEHMIVLNKAAGMVVHPAAGNWRGTVVNALAYYLPTSPYGSGEFIANGSMTAKNSNNNEDGEPVLFRPGIVHRLDKGTTGVLVVAKNSHALTSLSEAFANRQVQKTYLAITVGNPGKQVTIDKPIARHPIHRQRMRVVPDPHQRDSSGMAPKDRLLQQSLSSGRRALSFVDTLAFDGQLSVVQVRIATGRTHQIRVHLQDRHTPIYGDDVYGLKDWNDRLFKTQQIRDRPLLHAYKLQIEHPVTGHVMEFRAPLAEDMLRVAKTICPRGDDFEHSEIFET
ncbi:23S rRNA pseudouridine1911/1915/1917 synthase [Fistulifera solaris]|uniref:Pseudouridine synthase n=1 Tax=Fistulifera solaris TaxID=1519565 RepID=A0A1Z5KHH9_FISSO|nr:23S rRNA pseudouridine1911/1915/1917 synthase [Fistulifera solaris]|eukprot:GAX25575.1 23S rRNA pseudouridine1911/1915/1917 synthase [Fistulifera solaris]